VDARRLWAARTSRATRPPRPGGSIATRTESATRTDSTSSDHLEARLWHKGKRLVAPCGLGVAGVAAVRDGKTDEQPALVFKSWDYKKSSMDGSWRLHSIELLDEDEIEAICGEDERIKRLQEKLDDTAKNMGFGPGKRVTGPEGTGAHQRMKEELDKIKGGGTEILIAPDENGKFQVVDKKNNPKDSARLDLLLLNGKPTVCVEDHKFGEGGLDLRRTNNLVVKAADAFPDATRILIFQGKPTKTPRPNPE